MKYFVICVKQVLQIKAIDVENICNELNKLFIQESKFINKFIFNDKEFGFIAKLDDMTFGEYVDLDNYISDWQLMHKAMGVLYEL